MRPALHTRLRAMKRPGPPSPTLNLDFTTSLPGAVTFARTGSRTAIVSGVVTTVATGVPAIESWDGVNRGLALEPASTNVILQSNAFSTTWAAEQSTITSGVPGPDGNATSAWVVTEDTSNNYHGVHQTVNAVGAGVVTTASCFLAPKSGSVRWGAAVRQAIDFNNLGARALSIFNGQHGVMYLPDSNYTNPTCAVQYLANGWIRASITATNVATGNKRYGPRAANQDGTGDTEAFTGATTEGFSCFGFQVEHGVSAPTSYKATTTASAGSGGETAVISSIGFLNPSQGTFIIEHDCASGTILGSGTNVVVTGTVAGKTAYAWNGTTSDLVNNGGATTAGGLPTFGSDLRLLGTSAAQNVGHIKSLKYYPVRLSVAQMQALTAKTSTANPGVWRIASERNKLAVTTQAITGTTPTFLFRIPVKIGSGALSKLRLDFHNWFSGDLGPFNNGNAVILDAVALERVTGVSESVPVKFGGGRTLTLADGDSQIVSDDILPSQFTSYAQFNQGDQFFIKGRGHLAAAGNIPLGRWASETNVQSLYYDGAVTTYSSVDATGAFTLVSGTVGTTPSRAFSPVVIGVYVSGDPITMVCAGDSLMEGVGSLVNGTFIIKSTQNLHYSCLEYSHGGQGQRMMSRCTKWNGYMTYGRVLAVEMGTNDQTHVLDFLNAYSFARTAGVGAIAQCSTLPNSTSTDSWATETNQTTTRLFPTNPELTGQSLAALGAIQSFYKITAIRGTNSDKWLTNGSALAYTVDGTHPSTAGDDLVAAEYQPILAAVTAALV